MKEERIEKLLNELAGTTGEPVRGGLAEEIKQQVPHRFAPHWAGLDTINIIIDLRINKLAAAAIIVIMTVLFANFLDGRDMANDSIYQDGRLLVKYFLGSGDTNGSAAAATLKLKYENLLQEGREAVYYGDIIEAEDSGAVLMHWKIGDGEYMVIFGDLRRQTVNAEELIKLQVRMLQRKLTTDNTD